MLVVSIESYISDLSFLYCLTTRTASMRYVTFTQMGGAFTRQMFHEKSLNNVLNRSYPGFRAGMSIAFAVQMEMFSSSRCC